MTKELSRVRTIREAIAFKTPSLGLLIRSFDKSIVEDYIKLWIVGLNESINLTRPLKEHQIDECAFFIVNDHKMLTIADIKVVFTNAKKGAYGELYESLSIDKILSWFNDYFEERCSIFASRSVRESEEKKVLGKESRTGLITSHEFMAKRMKRIDEVRDGFAKAERQNKNKKRK